MATILIAEDEAKMRKILSMALMEDGHEILEAKDAEEASTLIRTTSISLVISDLRMPGGGGMAVLEAVQKINHYLPVIILTAYGTVENAVEALKNGAVDYLLKPCDLDEIKFAVRKALQLQQLELENLYLRNEITDRFGANELIGRSSAIRSVNDVVKRVAQNDGIVMIRGESGVGKEVAARSIHNQSARRERPFVTVKCAGTPADLLDIELFGRVRAAQGALSAPTAGKFELADKGTLFLDEIGELPPRIQGKLLRAIEEGTIEPVGGDRPKKVDVRLIVSTRADLEAKIESETFRSDLYYRLNVLPIHIPPLRERKDDIPLFIEHFLAHKQNGEETVAFSGADLKRMTDYRWPGNVRELINVIERAVVLGSTDADALLSTSIADNQNEPGAPSDEDLFAMPYKDAKKHVLEAFERSYFSRLLSQTNGNISRAAKLADVHRKNLHVKISELSIDAHSFAQPDDEDA